MRLFRSWVPVVLLVIAGSPSPAQAPPTGFTPEWQIQKTIRDLSAGVRRLEPLLEQIKPEDWVAKGASKTNVDQMKLLRAEIGYAIRTLQALEEKPDQMTLTLEAFLRVNAVESLLASVSGGVRSHQNPALADLLQGIAAENVDERAALRRYLVELVASKEQELRIVDEEAQRCRSDRLRNPAPPKK